MHTIDDAQKLQTYLTYLATPTAIHKMYGMNPIATPCDDN